MSFSTLRSSREAKHPRSFVQAPVDSEPSQGPTREKASAPDISQTGSCSKMTSDAPEIVLFEGLHKALPASLEARKSAESGRRVYSKQAYKPGAVLMSLKPHVSVLSTPYIDSFCSYCCAPALESGLKRCTRCRVLWYCDSKCQNNDWPLHKSECAALQRWAAEAPSPDLAIPSDAVRCLGRMLWTRRKEGLDSVWAREVNLMQSHRASLPPSAFESHTSLAHFVVRYIGVSSPVDLEPFGLASAGDLVDLISRFTTNTFTLTSISLTAIGVCVSPTIALINHSCEPNVAVVFPRASINPQDQEPLMHMVAMRDIAPSDEVLISYVDTTLPRELRQKELEETYNFVCKCTLCTRTSDVDPRVALWCPKSCGGRLPVPTEDNALSRCTNCRAALADADPVLDALRVGQEALDKANSLQFKDPEKAIQLTTNMLPILTSTRLTPSCHPLLAMNRLHQELLITSLHTSLTQELLDETIRTAAKYSAGLSLILPFGHPVRGVALAELGKLLAVDEVSAPTSSTAQAFPPSGAARLRLAHETLVRARDELVVGFGMDNGGGQVGRDVREAIVRLEKELGAWTQGIRNALEDTRASRSTSRH